MTDDAREVEAAVAGLVARHARSMTGTSDSGFDHELWSALEMAGYTDLGHGGSDLWMAAAVVRACAASAAMVPAAESVIVGRWLAAQIDAAVPPTGPVVTAWCDERNPADPLAVLIAPAVPWAVPPLTVLVVVDSGDVLSVIAPGTGVTISPTSPNLAGEPRADVVVHSRDATTVQCLAGATGAELRRRYALARAIALDAAITPAVAMTLQYAAQRHQFGRPIASFQLVRHRLTELIGERDSVSALVTTAILGRDADLCTSAIAARVRAAEAATTVARLSHQIHGAIGTTAEYRLAQLTRRLWAWRDEYGSQGEWESALGRRVMSAPDGLWPLLTSVPRVPSRDGR
jgi:acyl-CoA dehydrogenase